MVKDAALSNPERIVNTRLNENNNLKKLAKYKSMLLLNTMYHQHVLAIRKGLMWL